MSGSTGVATSSTPALKVSGPIPAAADDVAVAAGVVVVEGVFAPPASGTIKVPRSTSREAIVSFTSYVPGGSAASFAPPGFRPAAFLVLEDA